MNEEPLLSNTNKVQVHERTERLRDTANSTAGLVRNVYFTFLLFGAYFAITIGTTTDEQLLKISSVSLPILNVNLPIITFYIISPWLFLLFHANLLMQFYLLARQLQMFNAAITDLDDAEAEVEQRIRLFPFAFSHMLAGDQTQSLTKYVFSITVWITVILLPLFLLIGVQIRFLPYHDALMTWWHRVAVLVDLSVIWLFWPRIISPHSQSSCRWWFNAIRLSFGKIFKLWKLIRRPKTEPLADTEAKNIRGFLSLSAISLLFVVFSLFVAVVPGESVERIIVQILPKSWVTGKGMSNMGTSLLTNFFFDQEGSLFHRNLRLTEGLFVSGSIGAEANQGLRSNDKTIKQKAIDQVTGIDLTNRDLSFADMRKATIPKADLRGANLSGADLRGAILTQGKLGPAELPASGRCVTDEQLLSKDKIKNYRLRGAFERVLLHGETIVCRTNLNGISGTDADLSGAQLSFASMKEARLTKTNLSGSELTGVDLYDARLGYADLSQANLTAAQLKESQLHYTNLESADLTDAKLSSWKVHYTVLTGATLPPKAPLAGVKLKNLACAYLPEADLSGADLRGADLRGAYMEKANLRRAWLDETKMQFAWLKFAKLQGARLANSSLHYANLASAHLNGANLPGAKLYGVILRYTDLTAVDLSRASVAGASFIGTKLNLADLRNQNYHRLDRKIQARLVDYLDTHDITLWDSHMITAAIEKDSPSTFDLSIGESFLCDKERFELNVYRKLCLTEHDNEKYVAALANFACRDEDVAYGVAMRVMYYWWGIPASQRTKFSPLLSKALLNSECKGAGVLIDEHKNRLIKILEEAIENSDGPS